MTDSEKWSVWTLGVIASTTTAYFIFVALRGHGPATISVFALTALVAINKRSFRSVIGRALTNGKARSPAKRY